MQDYRRLRVWRKAHAHVLTVRRATNRFPRTGYSDLKSQLTKAAESIPFTLVEGCGAQTPKDTARFVDMSIRSSRELEYELFLARDYGVLPRPDWKRLTEETIDIRRMLCGFRRSILEGDEAERNKEEANEQEQEDEL